MSLESAITEVHQKIGRNLLAVQRIELNLKILVRLKGISGDVDTLQSNLEKHVSKVSNYTLGALATQYVSMHTDEDAEATSCEDANVEPVTKPVFKFSFSFSTSESQINERCDSINQLVTERNLMVHHFLERNALDSEDSCLIASKVLDEQYQRISAELERIRQEVKVLQELQTIYSDIMKSGQFDRMIEVATLNSHPLTASFVDVFKAFAQPDGWMILSQACNIVKQRLPEEYNNLKTNTGYKTIKAFLMATQAFEFREVKTDKDTIRLMFSVLPELSAPKVPN